MKSRMIGQSKLAVKPLSLGGNVFGWTIDEAMSFKVLDAFLAGGFDFIDTADVYSAWAPGNKGGESETIIGKWLKATGNRSKVVIATKVGLEVIPGQKGLSRNYIMQAVERSLNRLQIDTIDLYQSLRDDPATPLEETLGAFGELIQQGKVRFIGASNYSAARLSEAIKLSQEKKLPRYECLQPGYNLYDRSDYEAELEQLCLKEQIGVIPYYSLASGFLTGKYRSEADLSKSARGTKAKTYMTERGFKILAALDSVAARYQSTPGKIAIAWLLARPSITAPIASATNVDQLHDLLDATRLELDSEAVKTLTDASAY